jgi:hypothetical protein
MVSTRPKWARRAAAQTLLMAQATSGAYSNADLSAAGMANNPCFRNETPHGVEPMHVVNRARFHVPRIFAFA